MLFALSNVVRLAASVRTRAVRAYYSPRLLDVKRLDRNQVSGFKVGSGNRMLELISRRVQTVVANGRFQSTGPTNTNVFLQEVLAPFEKSVENQCSAQVDKIEAGNKVRESRDLGSSQETNAINTEENE